MDERTRTCPKCRGLQRLQYEVSHNGRAIVWHCLNCATRQYVWVQSFELDDEGLFSDSD